MKMQHTISLCMIVKNEEQCLERCLASVNDVVDEIIIVDTGSTDATVEIAKKYSAKIFHFKWRDDFSAARNFSLSKASKEWILVLDADEFLSSSDAKEIRNVIKTAEWEAFSFNRQEYLTNYLTGKSEFQGVSQKNLRLFKNNKKFSYIGTICEHVKAKSFSLGLDIMHHRDVLKMKFKEEYYEKLALNELEKNRILPSVLEMLMQRSLRETDCIRFYDFVKKIKLVDVNDQKLFLAFVPKLNCLNLDILNKKEKYALLKSLLLLKKIK